MQGGLTIGKLPTLIAVKSNEIKPFWQWGLANYRIAFKLLGYGKEKGGGHTKTATRAAF
jgi:hypothetical protein